MTFDLPTILGAAATVFAASTLQGAAGFGAALFAVPILLYLGFPLPQAVATTAVCSLTQSMNGCLHLRRDIPWHITPVATAVRLAFVFVGILLLGRLAGMEVIEVRFIVGCMICLVVLARITFRPRPVAHLNPLWGAVAFPLSGIMAGALGMGGPPLVLWAVAHDWPPRRVRGFLMSVFAASIPVQFIILWVKFGADVPRAGLLGLAIAPMALLGSTLGLHLGHRLSQRALRAVVYTLLIVISLNAMLPKTLALLFSTP
jgi:uncharacterized membrane protein YfcA